VTEKCGGGRCEKANVYFGLTEKSRVKGNLNNKK
jgi:hypothetical protein